MNNVSNNQYQGFGMGMGAVGGVNAPFQGMDTPGPGIPSVRARLNDILSRARSASGRIETVADAVFGYGPKGAVPGGTPTPPEEPSIDRLLDRIQATFNEIEQQLGRF